MNYIRYFLSFLIISLYFSTSPLCAMLSSEDQGQFNHSNIRRIMEKHIDLFNSSKGEDIVVFLGNTGSGKSTLINYLSGKDLIVNEGDINLLNPSDPSAMKIGLSSTSETLLPKFIKLNGLLFYDFPGFADTRGKAISLVNACFIKNIIEKAKTARVVFVAGQDELTAGRGSLFKQLFAITQNLIPNEPIEDFSSLVITKSSPESSKQQLITKLQAKTDPGVLTNWVEKGRLDQMHSPLMTTISQEDKESIIETILSTVPKKLSDINISAIYTDQEKNDLGIIYSGEIDAVSDLLVRSNFSSEGVSSLNMADLENKKLYFQGRFLHDLSSALDTSPLIELLRPISEEIYTFSLDAMKKKISLTAEKISGLITVEQEKRKAAEAARIAAQAERDRIAAQAEAARIAAQAERDRIAAQAERDRIAAAQAEAARIAAAQAEAARIAAQAERDRIARENDPNNWPQTIETQLEQVKSWQHGLGPRETYEGSWGRTKRRWPIMNKEMSVTITKTRTVARKPNGPQMVVLVDWQEASRTTPAPTGVQNQIGWEY